jgi:hypothetical protein
MGHFSVNLFSSLRNYSVGLLKDLYSIIQLLQCQQGIRVRAISKICQEPFLANLVVTQCVVRGLLLTESSNPPSAFHAKYKRRGRPSSPLQ